jgi:hypothetical protein
MNFIESHLNNKNKSHEKSMKSNISTKKYHAFSTEKITRGTHKEHHAAGRGQGHLDQLLSHRPAQAENPIGLGLGTWLGTNLPSGKLSHNYGKSPCLMGKSTINHHFQ